jgi:methylated-DNA-protein-cysteine methyltransferase-like protein
MLGMPRRAEEPDPGPTAGSFEDRVRRVIGDLRPGQVISYGEVAAEAGFPGAARAVGNLLRLGLPDVPWWRVVRADGRVVAPSAAEQIRRLRAEGVVVEDGRVRRGRAGR